MPSWWPKSSKDVKKKSNVESFIGSWHRKCIRPGAPRRHRSDTTSQKISRADSLSPSPSKQVSRCQSFGERPQAQPLPLPGSHFTNSYHADSGDRASKGPSVDRGSKTAVFHPLPKPGHGKIGKRAEVGERDLATASSSSDSSSDTDDPSDSRLLSPQASDYENGIKSDAASPSGLKQRDQFPFAKKKSSKEMSPAADILLHCRTSPESPNQRPVDAKVARIKVPHLSVPNSSMSSPSRSPMRGFCHEPIMNGGFWLGKPYADLPILGSGHGSSPSSVHNSGHNSFAGDGTCQLFWPNSRCSPECSPLPSPRMTSPGPSSRIHSGTVTPLHPCAGGPSAESPTAWLEDGRQQSHRLPLPPITSSNASSFTPSYSAGTSPRITRSPGRTDNPPSPGSRWKKGRLLGRGTFGHVYLGFNSESGEMCAMKEVTLFSDDAKSRESAQQLGQEIALLSRLHHPNIVQYYGSETVDDKLYIYLEFVSGGSIYKILQEYGQLGEAAIRSYTQQILSGLAYLHGKNTIHRDIKGANILVDPNGRVKLADFGMAKHITGQSCPLSFKGSPYWMAPEVIKNTSGCNLAVDIWSLGCTVLEMATTKPPWSQYEGVAAMFKIGNSKELPEIPNHLSEEGRSFVRQCLQRNPSHRPTAAQLLDHPFVKNSVSLERPVLIADPKESIPVLTHAVRALGFGHSRTPPCLDSSGTVNHSKTPKTVPGFSDAYMARNNTCAVPPVATARSSSRSPQHINGRLSPSPISSPRAASGASTPPGGGNLSTLPQYNLKNLHEGSGMVAMPQNAFPAHGNGSQEHKPDIFRGLIQAHLSLESVSRDNDIRGNKVERPAVHGKKEQLYDSHLVLADRVSQQLLRNPVRLNQGSELKPSSSLPSHRNRG
ncbi:mitogen-activated protein kinase kinase kinase YODA-like [Salvia miltiorrhiza]|uniref:mitogen-activated protein kinase kinase kinase YODA-like n=1 Tax=Salvia miltiorrhiza TaxID=226208 RepID=UPI0025AD07B0|nr:mitogen-activated protein kinase kinase kinase YODA-like [Salvia miltiorrhiza]XP_057800069.1 mitogen-activated protein kinase kinase kinase YODA-like [Salvia miltiorrhiza]XP_057800070.1 mitogen-activated protein kinase kinase kinase YODA-like [Salvia miltiorrhiza]XP_057800071.1 mitogen-activated protein kinase kinase kinase YODA-like [Salvia miltiorrhiza]